MQKIGQSCLRIVVIATLGILVANPSFAQDKGRSDMVDRSAELAREGIEKLMRALEKFIDAIPLYGAPYINERGDIVIPRLDPDTPRRPSPKPESEPGDEDAIDI